MTVSQKAAGREHRRWAKSRGRFWRKQTPTFMSPGPGGKLDTMLYQGVLRSNEFRAVRHHIPALVALRALGCSDGADEWPPGRIYHSMLGLNDGRLLMFGGVSRHGFGPMDLRDTWAYDISENIWQRLGGLEVGDVVGAAYDSESDRIITLNYAGETWAFNPATNEWEQRAPERAPSGRCGHGMAYDSRADRTILFGGFACTDITDPFLNDTWSYDYEADSWTFHEPQSSPAPRIYHSMIYHEGDDRIVIWGGRVEDTSIWVYDLEQNEWRARSQTYGPEQIGAYQSMAYDPATQLIFMFGGLALDEPMSFEGELLDETWSFDLASNMWTLHDPDNTPSARSHHSMALDQRGNLVVFGGETGSAYSDMMSDQVWLLDPKTVAWTEVAR